MNQVSYLLAEGAESGTPTLPMQHGNAPLLPMPYDMFWSTVCTIIILVLFWKYVLPKFMGVLEERENTISRAIANAKAAEEEAKNAREKYNEQLASARAEAQHIRDDARSRGKQLVDEAKAKATEENNRIIAQGEQQLAAERERVVGELRKDMGRNSITLAERLLGRELRDETKREETVDSFIADLDDVAPAGK